MISIKGRIATVSGDELAAVDRMARKWGVSRTKAFNRMMREGLEMLAARPGVAPSDTLARQRRGARGKS